MLMGVIVVINTNIDHIISWYFSLCKVEIRLNVFWNLKGLINYRYFNDLLREILSSTGIELSLTIIAFDYSTFFIVIPEVPDLEVIELFTLGLAGLHFKN